MASCTLQTRQKNCRASFFAALPSVRCTAGRLTAGLAAGKNCSRFWTQCSANLRSPSPRVARLSQLLLALFFEILRKVGGFENFATISSSAQGASDGCAAGFASS